VNVTALDLGGFPTVARAEAQATRAASCLLASLPASWQLDLPPLGGARVEPVGVAPVPDDVVSLVVRRDGLPGRLCVPSALAARWVDRAISGRELFAPARVLGPAERGVLIAVLAPVYIYYGFESAGDISEETKDAGRQVPRAMRLAVIWGGIGSLVLTAALLLSIPGDGSKGVNDAVAGNVSFILGQLPSGVQDFLLLMIIFAFFSCGTSIQGAGSRLAFSFARDEALPGSTWISRVHARFGTPVNALIGGAIITVLFCFPLYNIGLPWNADFSWDFANYTVLWFAGFGIVCVGSVGLVIVGLLQSTSPGR